MSVDIKTRKAWMLSIRTSNELRVKLEKAVAVSGRTLTQEVEMRLERSFMRDEFYGGPTTTAFVDLLGVAIKDVEAKFGGTWTSDPTAWEEVSGLTRRLLDERRPSFEKGE